MVRWIATLLLSLAGAVSAQAPDPTPPWAYDPIAVGNVWWYEPVAGPVPEPYVRVDSPTSIDTLGARWVVRRTLRYGLGHRARSEARQLVRYDTASANVLTITGAGEVVSLYPCRLDLPITEAAVECGGEGVYATYTVDPDAVVRIGDDEIETPVRHLDYGFPGPHLAAGVGFVYRMEEGSGGARLVHAVVGGDTLGALPPAFPTVTPDTTAPWRYYPLAVGNEWQYIEYYTWGWRFLRRRVVGKTEVEGRTYFEVEESDIEIDPMTGRPMGSTWAEVGRSLLRYDTLSARVVDPDGVSLTPCPFDEPNDVDLGGELVPCWVGEDPVLDRYGSSGGARTVTTRDGVSVAVASKRFRYAGIADGVADAIYVAGIGFYDVEGSWGLVEPTQFVYASVRQEDGSVWEIGARAVADEPPPEAARLGVRAFPSPASGPVTVAVSVPEAARLTVEAVDALGRRVWRTEADLPAGEHRLGVDAGAWAPGFYVVRASTGAGAATATVIRR